MFFSCFLCSSNPNDVARNVLQHMMDRDNQQGHSLQTNEQQHRHHHHHHLPPHEDQTCETVTKQKTYANEGDTTPDNRHRNSSHNANGTNAESTVIYGVVRKAIAKLQRKLQEPTKKKFYLHTRLDTHILPLTNISFDRNGERCITGSYDRTCRIISTHDGSVEHVLAEHDNVVFSVAYNFPKW